MIATPAEPHRVMLLDTYGLVYRAFFALPMLTTSRGEPINAAYGFTQMLNKLLADERPTHVIACFDKGKPRARVELYRAYKAQRETMPDELRSQFALVRRVLRTHRIPVLEVDGEEADDVIATLARQITERDGRAEVVTGDLDLLQIVDERTTVLTTRRGITDLGRYDPVAVRERFALEPRQLPDYRGLKGDPSDNLPGIPGIGEKTASKLIGAAGSLDALLADPTLAGTPKLERLIREHAEIARVCRDVSVIKHDLPIAMPWDEARYAAPSSDDLFVLYRDLEFKTLLARLPTPTLIDVPIAAPPLDGVYRSFVASTDPPEFVLLATTLAQAASAERVALARLGDTLGVSIGEGGGIAFASGALDDAEVARAFASLLARDGALAVHDGKSLLAALRPRVTRIPELADDTMLLAHLLDPSRSHADLADVASRLLERALDANAAAGADAVQRLVPMLRARLAERDQLALYEEVELPLVTALARMESHGIAVDVEVLRELATEVDVSIARLQAEIHELAGELFNIGSPQQLGVVLFERLKIPGGTRNKTGWATGVEILQVLAREHAICAKVLEYREVAKLKNTYIDVIPRSLGADGRLRTEFNQPTTATGRLSSTNPNLQNIPVRTELGRRVRRARSSPADADRVLAGGRLQSDRAPLHRAPSPVRPSDARGVRARRRHPRLHRAQPLRRRRRRPSRRQSAAHRQVGELRSAVRNVGVRPGAAIGDQPRRGARDHRGVLRALPVGARSLHRAHARGRTRARLCRDDSGPAALHARPALAALRAALRGRARGDQCSDARQRGRPHEARDGAHRPADPPARGRRDAAADPRRAGLRRPPRRARGGGGAGQARDGARTGAQRAAGRDREGRDRRSTSYMALAG